MTLVRRLNEFALLVVKKAALDPAVRHVPSPVAEENPELLPKVVDLMRT
jgi:hypothetical protein